MPASPASRLGSLTGELQALVSGTWVLLCQEMAGKATLTRRQVILMAAGALTALTAILLVLAGFTLLLSQLLVSEAGWRPLMAGGLSALIIAVFFAITGWLVFRNSGARLKTSSLLPRQTLQSIKTTAAALTNQPLIPHPPTTPMNTRQEFTDAMHQTADTVEHQAQRAARCAQSLGQKLDPGPFFASALAWMDAILTPQNRALAGRALTSAVALPRRHPAVAAMLGVGGLYLLWEKTREKSLQRMVADYTSEASGYADDLRKTAVKGFKATAEAGRDIRGSVQDAASRFTENGRNAAQQFSSAATQTAERVREAYQDARSSVGDGVEQIADTAHQLRKDAEAGYRKAREFAKEEPALAIAGGVALAIGAVLLVKSSRR